MHHLTLEAYRLSFEVLNQEDLPRIAMYMGTPWLCYTLQEYVLRDVLCGLRRRSDLEQKSQCAVPRTLAVDLLYSLETSLSSYLAEEWYT
jgi:hypothetical protein